MERELELPNGRPGALVSIQIRTPDQIYRRWVFEDERFTVDLDLREEAEASLAASGHGPDDGHDHGALLDHNFRPPDESILTTFDAGSQPVPMTLVAGPDEQELWLMTALLGGRPEWRRVQPGDAVTVLQTDEHRIDLEIDAYLPRSRVAVRPAIVPPSRRERDARETFSMVRVHAPPGLGGASVWVPFSRYPVRQPNETLRRFVYQPTELVLSDGRVLELVLSRERLVLPAPIVLEDFELITHVGGFTSSTLSVRDWRSWIRFGQDEGDTLTSPVSASMNKPGDHAGLWYFQAEWDPPAPARFAGDTPSAGLNYTVARHRQPQRRGRAAARLLHRRDRDDLRVLRQALPAATCEAARGRDALGGRMNTRARPRRTVLTLVSTLFVGAALLAAPTGPDADAADSVSTAPASFAETVDLSAWGRIAVHTDGRLQSFASFASTFMSYVTGSRSYQEQSAAFTYLDLLLRPEAYDDADIVYVKNKPMRAQIVAALRGQPHPPVAREAGFEARMTRFMKSGLLSERLLSQESVREFALAAEPRPDPHREIRRPDRVGPHGETGRLPRGRAADRAARRGRRHDAVARHQHRARIPGADRALAGTDRRQLRTDFQAVVSSWRDQDAAAFASASDSLATFLGSLRPDLYPEVSRLEWESRYFAWRNMTWVWFGVPARGDRAAALGRVPLEQGALDRPRVVRRRVRAPHGRDRVALVRLPALAEHEHVRGRDDVGVVRRVHRARARMALAPSRDARVVRARQRGRIDGRADGRALHAGFVVTEHQQHDAGARRPLVVHPHERDHRELRADLHGGAQRPRLPRLPLVRRAQGVRLRGWRGHVDPVGRCGRRRCGRRGLAGARFGGARARRRHDGAHGAVVRDALGGAW